MAIPTLLSLLYYKSIIKYNFIISTTTLYPTPSNMPQEISHSYPPTPTASPLYLTSYLHPQPLLIIRTIQNQRFVLPTLPTNIHLTFLQQFLKIRLQFLNRSTQMILIQTKTSHLYQYCLHLVIYHLPQQLLLVPVPQVCHRCQTMTITSMSSKNYIFYTLSFW